MTTSTTNGKAHDRRQAAAHRYIEMGLSVLPLPAESKVPALPKWEQLRITRDAVDRYFPAGADGNIGVLNGVPSGNIADADLDCDEARLAGPMLLPPTGWVFGRTSAPQSHYLYKTDVPLNAKAVEYHDLDGTMLVELRGTKSQTVFPPGVWRSKGEPYTTEPITWHTHTHPAELPLADLECAVAELAAAAIIARHWPAEGSRDDAALALSGALLRAGWEVEHAARFIEAVATAACDDEVRMRAGKPEGTARRQEGGKGTWGWTKLGELLGRDGKEVVKRAKQWLGLISGNSGNCGNEDTLPWPNMIPLGEVPEVPAFPVEVLPDMARRLVDETAWAMNCPPDFAALPVLALAGGALANSRHLGITRTHQQPPLLYGAVVSPPGAVKSPVLKLLRHPYDVIQSRYLEQWRVEMDAWESAGADKDSKKERGPMPVPKRCIVGDITTESLGLVLCENPRGVMIVRDELAALFSSMNQYKAGKGQDRQIYLALWGCDPFLIDRKSDKERRGAPLYVRSPFAGIIGSIQPAVLDRIRGERVRGLPPPDDGFMDRFLFTYPNGVKAIGEQWREVGRGTLDYWQDAIEQLMGLTMTKDPNVDHERPFFVNLTACGRAAWEVFTQRHADEVNDERFPGYLQGPWSKSRGYGARLALILHYLRKVGGEVKTEDVDGESMRRAAILVDYFKAHARKVYAVMDADPRIADARKAFHWITKNVPEDAARFQERDAYQGLKGTFKTVDDLVPVLTVLEKHHMVRPELQTGPRKRGRQASPFYEVNPECYAGGSHNSHNSHKCPAEADAGTGLPICGNNGNCGNGVDEEEPPPDADGGSGDGVPRPASDPPPSAPSTCPVARSSEHAPTGYDGAMNTSTITTPPAGLSTGYTLISTDAELSTVCRAVEECGLLVGLDLETSGLDPRTDTVRLLTLNVDTSETERFSYLVDVQAVDPSLLWGLLAEKDIIVHNGAFDLAFFRPLGFESGTVHDTMLLSQLLHAGEISVKHGLKDCVQRELGQTLDKTAQRSDWSGDLTAEQLEYAARDADVLVPLYQALAAKITEVNLEQAAAIERKALPALVWMGTAGVAFNQDTWRALAVQAEADVQTAESELDSLAPRKPDSLHDGSWTWSSTVQVKEVLKLVGVKVDDTGDATLAAIDHPLAAALRRYRDAAKRSSTYGKDWLEHVADDGRVYADWKQLGAASGRMSCRDPNLQQLPRGAYRRCIVAPPGRVLVKADYSQVELRIAAKVTGDAALLTAYQQGEDLHTLTAKRVLKVADVTKDHRQLAKALNFGLLYGMGFKGFCTYAKTTYGVELTEEQAKQYRDAFFRAYPKLAVWHRMTGAALDREKGDTYETRTLAGRRRLFTRSKKTNKLPYTEVLNTPVQGTGADGIKAALGLLWDRRAEVPGAFPVLAVHDEIVIECDELKAAGLVAPWLRQAMTDGMAPLIAPVPVEVEVTIAKTWAGN